MNDYTEFDKALIEKIRLGVSSFIRLAGGPLGEMAKALATPERHGYRDGFRVVDRRLQALRKKGVIAYSRKTGWAATPQERQGE